MTSAALLFEIFLTSIIIASTSSIPRCISCPCGSGNQSYTHCIDESLLKELTCDRWSHCETCEANKTYCITCPPGRFGPSCLENVHTRRKRQESPGFINQPAYPRQFGSCPTLERPESGSVRCSERGKERTCTSRCLPGFHFEGNENAKEYTLRCEGDGWKPQSYFPPCKSSGQCEVEVTGTGSGFYNCTINMEGTHCDITCDDKFRGRFHCYPGRRWNPPLPPCAAAKEVERTKSTCSDPGTPGNGFRVNPDGSDAFDSRSFREGESLIFSCNEGSGLSGSSFITCRADGTWSSSLPRCVDFGAGPVVPPNEVAQACLRMAVNPNVEMIYMFSEFRMKNEGFEIGEELRFECDENHNLEGPSRIECLPNGRWSSEPPTCNPRPGFVSTERVPPRGCPLLPDVDPNGRINEPLEETDDGFEPGTELTISCREGYILQGWNSIRCNSNGGWTPSPRCILDPRSNPGSDPNLKLCPEPEVDPNAKVEGFLNLDKRTATRHVPGMELIFECREGYGLEGYAKIECLETGEWSDPPPTCNREGNPSPGAAPDVSCVNPRHIPNGRIELFPAYGSSQPSPEDDEFPVGTHLKFRCDPGFKLVGGADSIDCELNGYWSGAEPICSRS